MSTAAKDAGMGNDDALIRSAARMTSGVSSHDSANVLAAGTRLFEFEIERVIGEGGFSVVYLALDLSLQRHIAI